MFRLLTAFIRIYLTNKSSLQASTIKRQRYYWTANGSNYNYGKLKLLYIHPLKSNKVSRSSKQSVNVERKQSYETQSLINQQIRFFSQRHINSSILFATTKLSSVVHILTDI